MSTAGSVPKATAATADISQRGFAAFQQLLLRHAGIHLAAGKKALVAGRLAKRLRQLGLQRYEDYLDRVGRDAEERQHAIDLLTTNETHFFREPPHFDLLRQRILPSLAAQRSLRFWSAAASTGQEAYSLAMVLASQCGGREWEVVGTDISRRVLDRARSGQYDLRLADEIPRDYLRAYCLRGVGAQAGTFVVAPALRQKVRFLPANLNETLPDLGLFDVALLRNVLIYFQPEVKRQVVARVVEKLRPGGWLLVGHSESLGELAGALRSVAPSVYRKP